MRLIVALTLLMLLAGCGPIAAAGYAADGLSAGASGKTVNDHFISQVTNMDCGLTRILRGNWVCRERGLDPEDDTIYMADGRAMDGPPRPWGTVAEPDLQYDDGSQYDARDWAEGTKLAKAPISDDPSEKMLAAEDVTDDRAARPARIGDMSDARDREDRQRTAARQVHVTQAKQEQHEQAAAPRYTVPSSAARRAAQTVAQTPPRPLTILGLPASSFSPGPHRAVVSTSPNIVGAPSAPQKLLPPAAAAAPRRQVAALPADGADALPSTAHPPPAALPRPRSHGESVDDAPPTTLPRPRDRGRTLDEAPPTTLPRLRGGDGHLASASRVALPRLRGSDERVATAPPTTLPRLRYGGWRVAAAPPDKLPRPRNSVNGAD